MQGHANQYPAQRFTLGCEEEAKVNTNERSDTYELASIRIDRITVGIQQIRADPHDEDLAELALDIQRHGLLQPIGVAPATSNSGHFQLLFGSRRLAAHLILNRQEITARVFREAGLDVRAVAMRENLHRKQMTLSEECDAVAHLHLEQNHPVDTVASMLAVGRQWVLRRLAIPGLPPIIRAAVIDGRIAAAAGERLARLPDAESQGYALQTTIAHGLTVGQVNELCQALDAQFAQPPTDTPDAAPVYRAAALATVLCGICELCHGQKPIEQLRMMRVCLTDCPAVDAPADADAQEHTHG